MVRSIVCLLLVAGLDPELLQSLTVRIEPGDSNERAAARVQVLVNASRPAAEQLRLEGASADTPRVVLSPRGKPLYSVYEKAVPASKTRLTVVHIGKAKLIVSLKPNAVLAVQYDDCSLWSLMSSWLAPVGDYCEDDKRDCKHGYAESTETAHADDEMCSRLAHGDSQNLKYCVREGQVRVRGEPGTRFKLVSEQPPEATEHVIPKSGITPYYFVLYQRCQRPAVETSSDRAVLGIGPDEQWSIKIGPDGQVAGGAVERSPGR